MEAGGRRNPTIRKGGEPMYRLTKQLDIANDILQYQSDNVDNHQKYMMVINNKIACGIILDDMPQAVDQVLFVTSDCDELFAFGSSVSIATNKPGSYTDPIDGDINVIHCIVPVENLDTFNKHVSKLQLLGVI